MNSPREIDWNVLAKSVKALADAVEHVKVNGAEKIPVERIFDDPKEYYKFRRTRDQLFEDGLFADPAWDMLIDLYIARCGGKQVSVSSLCIAAAVPATTALRWIGFLEERGLIERTADEFDRRRIFVQMTERALAPMRQLFPLSVESSPIRM
jgi:DNA-binding MarR family transcriptional regulator